MMRGAPNWFPLQVRRVYSVLTGSLCALTIGARYAGKINVVRPVIITAILKCGDGRSMLDSAPVMMGRNLPAVTSEAYGEYSHNYAVQ